MSTFFAEPGQIGADAQNIKSLAAPVQNCSFEVLNISAVLALEGSYSPMVRKRLREIAREIEGKSGNLKTLGTVLQDISRVYEKSENKIAGSVSESAGGGTSADGMTKEERDAYEEYRKEVEELLEILSGKRGWKECLQKWYELLRKGSFNDPKNCTLTKAEKEALLRFLAPALDGTTDGYNQLIAEVPFLGSLLGNISKIMNSGPANAVEMGLFGLVSINGLMASILGFRYNPGSDSYYTVEGSLQNQWGFNDAMDHWGSTLGMDLDTSISTFTYDGQEFRVQFWKGTYGYDGAVGGEFGIYSRPEWEAKGNPYVEGSKESRMILYEAVDEKYQVPVRQTTTYTRDSGRERHFTNDTGTYGDGDHYWNLNIRTEAGVEKQTVRSEYVIDCSKQGSGFCDAMYSSLQGEADLEVSRNGNVITVRY